MDSIALSVADFDIHQLTSLYNALHEADKDAKSLGKMGKAKVAERIAAKASAEGFDLCDGNSVAQLMGLGSLVKLREEWAKAAMDANKPSSGKANGKKKKGEPKKEKGPVIRVEAEKLLLEVVSRDNDGRPYGHSYEHILNTIKEQFDGAKTTVACLRWYAVHMRERGERLPYRPRASGKTE